MIRLSIQARQALSKLFLPLLLALACGIVLVGRADQRLAARLRAGVSDALAPAYAIAGGPIYALRNMAQHAADFADVGQENVRLRAENERLRRWYSVAMALSAENASLKGDLHFIPDPAPSFVSAHVVADTGGIYARAVLLAVGPNHAVSRGQIALDADGLVGRVTQVGARSARILLITDADSRVPVTLAGSHAPAIVTGTNAPVPRLMYYPEDVHPEEGERVVTSSEAGAFPAGLPVGVVHYLHPNQPVVLPAAHLDHLDVVRIFDYGLTTIVPPDAPGHVPAGLPGPAAHARHAGG